MMIVGRSRKTEKQDRQFERLLSGCEDNLAPKGLPCLDAIIDADGLSDASDDSESTMATMDNNPGAGRVLDTYFFQPGGKRVEGWIKSVAAALVPAFDTSAAGAHSASTNVNTGNDAEDRAADRDSLSTASTVSTTATFDNLPGPGRIIDMHFYQPTGRRIERLAVRITFPFLTPGNITRRISGMLPESYFLPRIDVRSPGNIIHDIARHTVWDGHTVVVGLKSLVKQTSSKTIYRSAAAFSGLLRLSADHFLFIELFSALVHTDTSGLSLSTPLADTLDQTDPLRKYLVLLSSLSRSALVLSQLNIPTRERAQVMAKTVLLISQRRKSETEDLFTAISDAFTPFAKCAACIIALDSEQVVYDDPAMDDIVEAASLISIFLIRSLVTLWNTPLPADPRVSKYHKLLVHTYVHWVNKTLSSVIFSFSELSTTSVRTAALIISLRAPFYAFPVLQQLFPDCVSYSRALPVLPSSVLPRRLRKDHLNTPLDLESLRRVVTSYTTELLLSEEALERELRMFLKRDRRSMPPNSNDDERALREMQRAEEVDVSKSNLTRDFLSARCRKPKERQEEHILRWRKYKGNRRAQHAWDQHLRSVYDWEPGSLRWLFKL